MATPFARHAAAAALVGLVVGVGWVPVGQGQAQPRAPSSGITVFEHINYRGAVVTFTRDTSDLRPSRMNGRISSFITAPNEVWEVCTGRNFTGRCQTFSGREPDLTRRNLNDMIESLRRVRGGRGGSQPPPSSPRLELFAGKDFSGQRVVLTGPAPDFTNRNVRFNDRAMSIRMPAGQSWEICVNINYDDCRVVTESMPDLGVIGFNRVVSSARPRVTGRGR